MSDVPLYARKSGTALNASAAHGASHSRSHLLSLSFSRTQALPSPMGLDEATGEAAGGGLAKMLEASGGSVQASTLNLKTSTLHPQPCTLSPAPYTLNSAP